MKRYSIDELTRAKDKNGDYCEYDEVNETIMNMVDEFAETAKEYEAEIAKKDELIKEQYSKIEELNESNEAAWTWKKEYEAELAKKDEEIARLKEKLKKLQIMWDAPEEEGE